MSNPNKKWLNLPLEFRKKLVKNVFCGSCLGVVEIKQYVIRDDRFGVVLEGKCKDCGGDVARLVEMELELED